MENALSIARPEVENVLPIIRRQKTVEATLWCRQCSLVWDYVIPATMPFRMVFCVGCEVEGFLEPG